LTVVELTSTSGWMRGIVAHWSLARAGKGVETRRLVGEGDTYKKGDVLVRPVKEVGETGE